MKPKVSVIIPVYNVEQYLRECLDSVVGQSLKDIEIICVNDGSTDGSLDILREYASQDDRIAVINKTEIAGSPKGAGYARNVGLDKARGDYVTFLDADDYFEPDFLSCMHEKASSLNADVCLCGAFSYYCSSGEEKKNTAILRLDDLNGLPFFSPFECSRMLFSITTPAPWSKLYSRSYLQDHDLRFQEIKNSNDIFFYVASMSSARLISYVPRCFIHYRIGRKGSLQTDNLARNTGDYARALMVSAEYLADRPDLKELSRSFSTFAADVVSSNTTLVDSYAQWSDNHLTAQRALSDLDTLFRKEGWCVSNRWIALKDSFLNCSPEEFLYKRFKQEVFKCSDLSKRILIVEKDCAKAQEKCRAIRSSHSFRIGRAATLPVRALKRVFK